MFSRNPHISGFPGFPVSPVSPVSPVFLVFLVFPLVLTCSVPVQFRKMSEPREKISDVSGVAACGVPIPSARIGPEALKTHTIDSPATAPLLLQWLQLLQWRSAAGPLQD